jgi:anti-sigma regulatory factor (Ser/Thr protein kinase)
VRISQAECSESQLTAGRSMSTATAATDIPAWPLRSSRDLDAEDTAPGDARKYVTQVMLQWGLTDIAETAELLVSELVTNAVIASRRLGTVTGAIRLRMISDEKSLVIHVWDGFPEMPAMRDASPDDLDGRGLMLVDALALEWGSYRRPPGKTVWCRL